MDQHMVWLIILLVVGVVVSNLMVLKYSAKFKWPSKTDRNGQSNGEDDDSDTSEQDKQ